MGHLLFFFPIKETVYIEQWKSLWLHLLNGSCAIHAYCWYIVVILTVTSETVLWNGNSRICHSVFLQKILLIKIIEPKNIRCTFLSVGHSARD